MIIVQTYENKLLLLLLLFEDILIFSLVSYAHEFLISSSDIDSISSVNEKSLDLLFDNHFISLDPDKYLHLQSFYLFTGSKFRLYFPGLLVQITESRLVTMSVSLHTQAGLCCLTM